LKEVEASGASRSCHSTAKDLKRAGLQVLPEMIQPSSLFDRAGSLFQQVSNRPETSFQTGYRITKVGINLRSLPSSGHVEVHDSVALIKIIQVVATPALHRSSKSPLSEKCTEAAVSF